MCSICNQFVCPAACPNSNGARVYTCQECGDGIYIGESYYKIKDSYYHKECISDAYSKQDILGLFGITPRIAQGLNISLLLIGEKNGK